MDRLWARKTAMDNDANQREPRRKQIESLFMELPQLRAVPNDDSRFQLTLQLANNSESSLTTSSSLPHISRNSSSPASNNKSLSQSNQFPPEASLAISGIGGGQGNSTATMTIYLPPAFPEEEPKITIQPTVRHFWVDSTVAPCAVTGHERLVPGGWSTHANLGRIVKEIVASIQKTGVLVVSEYGDNNAVTPMGTILSSAGNHYNCNNASGNSNIGYDEYSFKPPPPIPGPRTKSLGQTMSSFINTNGSLHQPSATGPGSNATFSRSISTASTGNLSNHHHPQNHPTSSSSSSSAVYGSTESPEARIVMKLTSEQIEEYLESPIAFENFFNQIDTVVNNRTLRRELWHGNDNVARRNLTLESEMLELQKSTKEGYSVALQLQKSLEEKLQQQQDALWRFKPETLQSKLRSAAAESDELSESVAQSFLEGKLGQEDFIRQYRELRKVYHLREMKNERIGPILRSSNSSNGGIGGSGPGSAGQDSAGSIARSGIGNAAVGGVAGTGSAGGTSGASSSDPWVML